MWKLFLVFTLIPAVEMILLLKLAEVMGAWETVGLILVTGLVGATLAKREGLTVLRQLAAEASQGLPPADRLVEGLMVLIGGVLLITPGVLTDLAGFFLIFPLTRRPLAPIIKRLVVSRLLGGMSAGSQGGGFVFRMGGVPPGPAQRGQSAEPPRPPLGPFDHPTV
ncbi:MAG: FxsA family protein [Deltaproteobacteria bacterium]|nr:FxsA family protein [Deltaproteobacteria bacterium]